MEKRGLGIYDPGQGEELSNAPQGYIKDEGISLLPLGRPKRTWKDNIKTSHQEMVWRSVDLAAMTKDRERN